jgi:hypothetical protein
LAKFTGIIANIFADPPGEPLAAKALHQMAVIKTITRGEPNYRRSMISTDAMRMRQKTQRLQIPDQPVSNSISKSGIGLFTN